MLLLQWRGGGRIRLNLENKFSVEELSSCVVSRCKLRIKQHHMFQPEPPWSRSTGPDQHRPPRTTRVKGPGLTLGPGAGRALFSAVLMSDIFICFSFCIFFTRVQNFVQLWLFLSAL